MKFLKALFNKKEAPLQSYEDFWIWFSKHEKQFYQTVQQRADIQEAFFVPLSNKLDELREGFYFLVGMSGDNQAELVLTADGIVKNIVFVEELAAAAPQLDNWKITALKQPTTIQNSSINMNGYEFSDKTMSFYAIEHPNMPDEIDLVITHQDRTEDNKNDIINGAFLAVDSYLGELPSVTTIDNMTVIHPSQATQPLIPLEKLKNFLMWREKEFVEKYKGLRRNTEEGNYISAEATLNNGMPLFAIINADLLEWDSKASHPWMTTVQLHYDGSETEGLPPPDTLQLLNDIEDEIMLHLQGEEGYLNVGRQTANSVREIYIAGVDFRKPAKILDAVQKKYQAQLTIELDIYKDKYWQTLNRFSPH